MPPKSKLRKQSTPSGVGRKIKPSIRLSTNLNPKSTKPNPTLSARNAISSGRLPPVATGTTSSSKGGIQIGSVPTSIGMSLPKSFFGFIGRAQALADMDSTQSLRVTGRDLFYLPIKSGSSTAAAGFGGTGTYYANIAPLEISSRLGNLEEIFLYYAIRHLRIFYAPATASTSTTQIALGYAPDQPNTETITAPTMTQIMEFASSALFSAWMPCMFEMKHEGTRLYSCSSAGGEPLNFDYQGCLGCTLLNGVSSTTYGQLWVEYVIDFYQPTPVLSDPTLCLTDMSVCKQREPRRFIEQNPIKSLIVDEEKTCEGPSIAITPDSPGDYVTSLISYAEANGQVPKMIQVGATSSSSTTPSPALRGPAVPVKLTKKL